MSSLKESIHTDNVSARRTTAAATMNKEPSTSAPRTTSASSSSVLAGPQQSTCTDGECTRVRAERRQLVAEENAQNKAHINNPQKTLQGQSTSSSSSSVILEHNTNNNNKNTINESRNGVGVPTNDRPPDSHPITPAVFADDHNTPEWEEQLGVIGRSVAIIHVSGFSKSFRAPWLPGERTGGTGTGWFVKPPFTQQQDNDVDNEPVKYILTCFHVVESASLTTPIKIQTVATDKKRIPARIVAVMPQVDAALLEVIDPDILDQRIFRAWPVGDSKTLKPGSKLSVYGYPLGMDRIKVLDMMMNGIQFGVGQVDGAINPGHSGAPVVKDGKVIGYIISGIPSVMASNVSFFQPIAYMKALWHDIKPSMQNQVIRRGRLGVEYQNTTNSFLEMVGTGPSRKNEATGKSDCSSGVVVQHVSRLSPLIEDPIQIKPLDVLCSFEASIDGQKYFFDIDNEGDVEVPWYKEKMHLPDVLHMVRRNDPIVFHVWKTDDKRLVSHNIILPEINVNGFRRLYPPFDAIPYVAFAGLLVQPMSSNIRHAFRELYKCTQYQEIERPSLVIIDVFGNSAVEEANSLQRGSIITHVNGRPVTSIAEYRNAVANNITQGKFLTFRTKDNEFATLMADRVVREEPQLAEQYGYPLDKDLLTALTNQLQGTTTTIMSPIIESNTRLSQHK